MKRSALILLLLLGLPLASSFPVACGSEKEPAVWDIEILSHESDSVYDPIFVKGEKWDAYVRYVHGSIYKSSSRPISYVEIKVEWYSSDGQVKTCYGYVHNIDSEEASPFTVGKDDVCVRDLLAFKGGCAIQCGSIEYGDLHPSGPL